MPGTNEAATAHSAERTWASVLFADLVGFTALSERLGPERAYFIVTDCLKLLDEIVREHGGAVDKYLGDCLMALFGHPTPVEHAAARALLAAHAMRRRVGDYNRKLELELPLGLRIGVNTGMMVAGDVRGTVIREFHVLGDTVNVAARLKARAPIGSVFVGPETITACESRFRFGAPIDLELKGKRAAVRAGELLGPRTEVEQTRGSWRKVVPAERVGVAPPGPDTRAVGGREIGDVDSPAAPSRRALSAKNGERTSEGERRRATILFADISGFTAMTEELGAERAYPIVVGCLEVLQNVALAHGGTVDKLLGDCVMALFGVPEAIEDAPRAAVNAAIEMRARVREYSKRRGLRQPLDVHTGINTGLGISGDISGPLIREFAVMGDPVDVASRLSDDAPAGKVFVGPETHRLTGDLFEYRPGGPIQLPGGEVSIPTFELRSTEPHLHRRRIGAERQVFSALVGRDDEMAALRAAVVRVAHGEGGIVSLSAHAGIGKSRLLAELRASPAAAGLDWREGRSLSTGVRLSLHPFADLCRSWAAIEDDDDDDAARGKLRDTLSKLLHEDAPSVFPLLATILGLRLDAENERQLAEIPVEAKEKMIRRALLLMLRRSSEQRPVLVVMEDLHWADLASIELLESLLPLAEKHAVLFVNAFRPGSDATSERIRKFAAEQHGERHLEVELAPLPRDATHRLIANLFREADLPHVTRDLIERKAQGNPFFVEEVVRSLVDAGAVEFRDGSFHATAKIHDAVIPDTIQEVVMTRVDALPLSSKRILRAASVIGRSFHYDVLAEIVGGDSELEETLQALRDAEFLVPWDQFRGLEFAFKHALLQEVTYDSILEARRSELHLSAAEAIESRLSDDVPGFFGMLAYHFSLGGDAERAETHLFRAGDEAAKVAASGEALHFFEQAATLYFEQHGEGGDKAKLARLQRKIASALFHRGRLIDAVEHIDQTLSLLGQRVPRRSVELGMRFARDLVAVLTKLYLPLLSRSPEPATQSQQEIIELGFDRAEAETTSSPARFLFDTVNTLARLDRLEPATVPGAGGMYASVVGIFSFGGISFGISRRFLERAGPLVDRKDPREQFLFRVMSFLHHFLEGDWSREHEIDAELVSENLQLGQLWPVTTYLGLLAEKQIHTGDFGIAAETTAAVDEIWDLYQYDLAKTNHFALPMYMALQQRRLDDALAAADVYYDEVPEDLLHILALSSKAKALVQCGQLEPAETCLERAARIVKRSKPVPPFHLSGFCRSRLLLDLAQLDGERRVRGRTPHALRRRAASDVRATLHLARKVAWQRPEAYRLAARFHWLTGGHRKARSLWGLSLQEAKRLGTRPELGRTYAEIGRLLPRERGDVGRVAGFDAETYTEMAAETFEALGLDGDLAVLTSPP